MIGGLFVAGRGAAAFDGLHYFLEEDGLWRGEQLATVEELAALCWHPSLSVVYGLSGLERGLLHVWDVSAVPAGAAIETDTVDCQGEIPCDLAVDPSGRLLVSANFGSGSLTVWTLDAAGRPRGEGEAVPLQGGSVADLTGQAGPHPHQIVFSGGLLYVPDYGADLVRVFAVDADRAAGGSAAKVLTERAGIPVPVGTAPRHMAILPPSVEASAAEAEAEAAEVVAAAGTVARAVVSGERSSAILLGPLAGDDSGSWSLRPGTERTGPARSRHEQNYAGDIRLSVEGATAFFANRGYDTVSAFDLRSGEPRLLWEVDSGTRWPQHLLVRGEQLLVAGWDSDAVAALSLSGEEPGDAVVLFECGGAGWLLADRAR